METQPTSTASVAPSPAIESTPVAPQTFPLVKGIKLEKISFQDFGAIRVVFDALTGQILGVIKAQKVRKAKV